MNLNKSSFSKKIGISNNVTIHRIINEDRKPSFEVLDKILLTFGSLNANWLMKGDGSMFLSEGDLKDGNVNLKVNPSINLIDQKSSKRPNYDSSRKEIANMVSEDKSVFCMSTEQKIPLVSIAAVAGFGSAEFAIGERDVKAYYVVPKFKDRKIDFMIEITGSSMYPKYNSGDVVACKIIKESTFLQWNKVHIIATKEQGILIKRLKKGTDDDRLLIISDNKDYDPFEIQKNEITGLAIVVGVIRLE